MLRPDETERRWLALRAIYRGREYRLALVTLRRGIGGMEVSVEPFAAETHSTVFVSGTIHVSDYPPYISFDGSK